MPGCCLSFPLFVSSVQRVYSYLLQFLFSAAQNNSLECLIYQAIAEVLFRVPDIPLPGSDTTTLFYPAIKMHPQLRVVYYQDTVERNKDLQKGRLSAIIGIRQTNDSSSAHRSEVSIYSTSGGA